MNTQWGVFLLCDVQSACVMFHRANGPSVVSSGAFLENVLCSAHYVWCTFTVDPQSTAWICWKKNKFFCKNTLSRDTLWYQNSWILSFLGLYWCVISKNTLKYWQMRPWRGRSADISDYDRLPKSLSSRALYGKSTMQYRQLGHLEEGMS